MSLEDIFHDWPDEVKYCCNPDSEHFRLGIFNNLERINAMYEQGTVPLAPKREHVFRAFKLTSFDETRVVILGQDPYPSMHKDQHVAIGIAFGVENDVPTPKSLQNILKALPEDVFRRSDLLDWTKQGVLMANTALTIPVKGKPKTHLNLWSNFTSLILRTLNEYKEGLVFVLWGAEAQRYKKFIDTDKHHVVEDIHPAAPCYNPKLKFTGKFEEINSLLNTKIHF